MRVRRLVQSALVPESVTEGVPHEKDTLRVRQFEIMGKGWKVGGGLVTEVGLQCGHH